MALELRAGPAGVSFAVRVQPRASREAILGERDGALRVRLTAPPVEGAANDALRRLLAKALGTAPSAVEILRGEHGRDKQVRVTGVAPEAVAALAALEGK
ncbi:MAG: DUF167 domain-containing protein [Vicinamibacteria bacterium]